MAISKIIINKSKCIGCGTCMVLAPNLFKLTEEGHSEVGLENLENISQETIINASKSCPTGAIELYDEKGDRK